MVLNGMSDKPQYVKGRGGLAPGYSSSPATKISPDNNPGQGRPWLTEQERELLRAICPTAINHALVLIEHHLTPPDVKIQAIGLILSYAYGTPQIATIVNYEVDLICKEYGLPRRTKLTDRHGNRLFGGQGGFKPSFNNKLSGERVKFIERMEAAILREQQDLDAEAANKLRPPVTTYTPPLRPKELALKNLAAEQERVDRMKDEIRQAEYDLQEMKDIHEEADKTLRAMRDAYIAMPPDPVEPDSARQEPSNDEPI